MTSRARLASFVFALTTFAASFAWAVELVVWRHSPNAPRVILPKLDHETAEQAVARYLKAVETNPDLRSLIDEKGLGAGVGEVKPLTAAESSKVRMAFIANWMADMTDQGARIERNLTRFSAAGADPYVIALSADVGLAEKDASDFREKVARSFDLLTSLGGHDIDPSLYGEKKTFSGNTSLTRDRSEIALVRAFKKEGRGMFFGICRGHQMGAIADGDKLHQDLTKTGAGVTADHIAPWSEANPAMQKWHHIVVEKGTLLWRFLRKHVDADGRVLVNSVHHQAVHETGDAESFTTARHDTSGVEGRQQKNGKGMTVQFHPEFPESISGNAEFSRMGFDLIKGVISYARLQRIRAGSCAHVFD